MRPYWPNKQVLSSPESDICVALLFVLVRSLLSCVVPFEFVYWN